MRLGRHVITVRRATPRLNPDTTPVLDDYGDPVVDVTDTEVTGCLVVPSSRTSDTREPRDRAAPRIAGLELYAPPATDLRATDVVLWPPVNPTTWQVEGDVGVWDESIEARLIRAT